MSTWLRKTKGVPGAAGGYAWNTTEDVVEVEDDGFAADLLEIPDAGYVSVAAPERTADETGGEKEEDGASQDAEGEAAPAKPARKTAASKAAAVKTQVQE